MSKSLSKHLTGAGLALVFCGVVLSLRGIGLWHGHYSGGGAIYTLNNCLKLTFFALACWQFYAVGRFILGKWRVESALWQGVVSLLCGMGIVSITMPCVGINPCHVLSGGVYFLFGGDGAFRFFFFTMPWLALERGSPHCGRRASPARYCR